MKVAPEEYLGMMLAFETALNIDEEADFKEKRAKFSRIIDQLKDIPGLKTNVILDQGLVSELYLDLEWDQSIIKLTIPEFVENLEKGKPSIRIRMLKFAGGRAQISATVLADGQDITVGRQVCDLLMAHS